MARTARTTNAALQLLIEAPNDSKLTQLGCPDCRGVLTVRELGDAGYLSFTCHVGHTFSQDSLLERKETELEDSLWIAAETSAELKRLIQVHAERARAEGANEMVTFMEQKLRGAAAFEDELRTMLARGLVLPEATK